MISKILIVIFIIMVAIVYSRNKDDNKSQIKVKDKAPLFKAIDHSNNEISFQDYLGNYVVIYFFPKAFTPGWTKQACGFRDKYSIYKENNIIVLGVSYDEPKKLDKFRKKHNLPFTFISDKDKTISKQYNSGGMLFPSRKTIIVDPEGFVLNLIDNVNIETHSDDIIKIVLDDVKSKQND